MRKLESGEKLIKSGLLKTADVLLMHTRRSPRAAVIRRSIHSYWNHALLVQVTADGSGGPGRTLIVDPKMSGLEVADVAYYLQRPDVYDAAVKRFEGAWFMKRDETGLAGPDCVLNLALKKVTENRGSPSRWRPVMRFLRQFKLVLPQPGWNGAGGKAARGAGAPPQKPVDVTAYTCSGFVQWCYYKSVSAAVHLKGLDATRLSETIFNPRLTGAAPTDKELLSTTPGDLARSENLSWKYVIKDGRVWEVSSAGEVRQICEGKGLAHAGI